MSGTVLSVNVGSIREVFHNGRTTTTGIWKEPVGDRVQLRDHKVSGDAIANTENHGGPDKAVYAYSTDDLAWWRSAQGRIVLPGAMGENLTLVDVAASQANVGDRWAIGTAVLEVAGPRTPCFKLGLRHDDQDIVDEFRQSLRWGSYLRIITEGDVGKGDAVEVIPATGSTMSVGDIAKIYHDEQHRAAEFLLVPRIGAEWIRFAEATLAKAESD